MLLEVLPSLPITNIERKATMHIHDEGAGQLYMGKVIMHTRIHTSSAMAKAE